MMEIKNYYDGKEVCTHNKGEKTIRYYFYFCMDADAEMVESLCSFSKFEDTIEDIFEGEFLSYPKYSKKNFSKLIKRLENERINN